MADDATIAVWKQCLEDLNELLACDPAGDAREEACALRVLKFVAQTAPLSSSTHDTLVQELQVAARFERRVCMQCHVFVSCRCRPEGAEVAESGGVKAPAMR